MKPPIASTPSARYRVMMGTSPISGVHSVCRALVLIVEDDPDSAELFAGWLRAAGLSVAIVNDAEGAMILGPVLNPAVVVIDLGLPTSDGLALVDELRAIRKLGSQYIAVTAFSGPGLPLLCQAAGFSAFFQKPVDRAALVRSVLAMASADAH